MGSRTVFAVLEETAARLGKHPALHQPLPGRGTRKYRTLSWIEYKEAVIEIACGLRALGIREGDVVALNAETRMEFYLADVGVMSNGSVAAAMYTNYPVAHQAEAIFTCGARAVVVENQRTFEALYPEVTDAKSLTWIVLDGDAPAGSISLNDLRAKGRAALKKDKRYFDRIRGSFTPRDTAILYLTSGATGAPKMGLVSHAAATNNIRLGAKALDFTPRDVVIAFLPSAHIAQRVVIELLPLQMGLQVWFSAGLSSLASEMRELRPTWFLAPPRVWERIYATIRTEIRKRPVPVQKLFHGALGLGLEASRLRQQGKPLPAWMSKALKLADMMVFRKIRERFGGRMRFPASGAAPLGLELARFYAAIGMPLVEGYGLTEGGVISFTPVDRPKAGSIGVPLPGVEVRTGEDGELLVRSPFLFDGYLDDEDSTANVLKGGWLHTGDIAEIDHDGYIFITGRKKELIVASNGKKIYPSRIECLLKEEPLINQVLLVGDRMPFVTALFTLNTAAAEGLRGMEQFRDASLSALAKAPPVMRELREAVRRANKKLAPWEQVRGFRVLDRDFTVEDGELTPTMKVRRQCALENFRMLIQEMYAGKEEMV